MRLVKMMFILSRDQYLAKRFPVYDFVPYKFGPFSFEMYDDLRRLEARGYVREQDEDIIIERELDEHLDDRIVGIVDRMVHDLCDTEDFAIVKDIYDNYPDYTIFSQLEQREVYVRDETGIITIGYQDTNIDEFLNKLIWNKVQRVIDVRKNAFSMSYMFSKGRLSDILSKFDVDYFHQPELGIEPEERKELKTLVDYKNLFVKYRKKMSEDNSQIENLIEQSKTKKIAMLCYESDPNYCHRGVLADMIRERGYGVIDI